MWEIIEKNNPVVYKHETEEEARKFLNNLIKRRKYWDGITVGEAIYLQGVETYPLLSEYNGVNYMASFVQIQEVEG